MIKRLSVAVGAGAVVENVLAGNSIEYASEDSTLTVAAATTAVGFNMAMRLTDEVILDESQVPVTTNGQPIVPDQIIVPRQAVARGDHLILRLQNTTGVSLTAVILVELAPI